ncbi:unnamed protein product [Urochloa decumbens]|uniref:TF-B3 domain-containing protein n=1 Tax=Urochloa decumbens TaxID=240449 RepID=A0ABC9CCC3_9POAL
MPSSGNTAAAAARKHLRVLLPFSCDSLRIPEEMAGEIGAGEARIVGRLKVRGVEVARDGGGAFLRRGWPEFADACGVSPGCSLVLRHHGGGVLTVKVFDASCCLRELGSPPPAGEATASSKAAPWKPQFICILSPDSMENLLVPAKFVQHCIPKEHLNNRAAATFDLLGKISQVELEMNQSGVFFTSGWSQFLAFHSITEVNALLLRYESNMVFTVKVFECDGCQRGSKHNDIAMQQNVEELQEAPFASNLKRCKIELPSSEGEKIPEGSKNPLNKPSLQRNSVYKIRPPAWIQKHMNASTLKKGLALAKVFCDAIGLCKPCTITLKTSISSTESWPVCGHPNKEKSYLLVKGWNTFCQENSLKQRDICTFSVIETTLWHVVIIRC